jgi:hypothetical protein
LLEKRQKKGPFEAKKAGFLLFWESLGRNVRGGAAIGLAGLILAGNLSQDKV